MEASYIKILMQDMLDWKTSDHIKQEWMNGKDNNSKIRVCENVYINSLRIL